MIEGQIQTADFENYLAAVASCKEVIDGVSCWSLRKLCSIFEVSFPEIKREKQDTISQPVSAGNKSGYSLGYYEFDGLKEKRVKSFVKELSIKADTDGYVTEIEDYLLNGYMFYNLAKHFLWNTKYVLRLKDYIVLEIAQTFLREDK